MIELPSAKDSILERHHGVTRVILRGDRRIAEAYVDRGQVYMGWLRHNLALGGINYGVRTIPLAHGVKIRVTYTGAMNIIEIYAPPANPVSPLGNTIGMRYPNFHDMTSNFLRYEGHPLAKTQDEAFLTYGPGEPISGGIAYWNQGTFGRSWTFDETPWTVYWSGAQKDGNAPHEPPPRVITPSGGGHIEGGSVLDSWGDTWAIYLIELKIHADIALDSTYLWLPSRRIYEYSYDVYARGYWIFPESGPEYYALDTWTVDIKYQRERLFDENPWGDWLSTTASGSVYETGSGAWPASETYYVPITYTMRLVCAEHPEYNKTTTQDGGHFGSFNYNMANYIKAYDPANLAGSADPVGGFYYPGSYTHVDIIYVPVYEINYWDNMTCWGRMLEDYQFRVENGLNFV